MEIAILIWLIMGIAAGVIGSKNEGRGGCGWFLIGLLLGPIGLMFAFSAKDKTVIPCPQCAEDIKKEANICKHCGAKFGSQNQAET